MTKHRLLLLALLGAMVGLTALFWWAAARPQAGINPETFERLCEGMTEQEVQRIISVPDGDYRTWQRQPGGFNLMKDFGERGRGTQKWWQGNNYWIMIGFKDGKSVEGRLGETVEFHRQEPFFTMIRRRLGL
jgi:hypothetical protein